MIPRLYLSYPLSPPRRTFSYDFRSLSLIPYLNSIRRRHVARITRDNRLPVIRSPPRNSRFHPNLSRTVAPAFVSRCGVSSLGERRLTGERYPDPQFSRKAYRSLQEFPYLASIITLIYLRILNRFEKIPGGLGISDCLRNRIFLFIFSEFTEADSSSRRGNRAPSATPSPSPGSPRCGGAGAEGGRGTLQRTEGGSLRANGNDGFG